MSDTSKADKTLATSELDEFECTGLLAVGDAAIRLKRLGICVGRSIQLISTGDPMIVRVCGSRIGLSRTLAEMVLVRAAATSSSER